MAPIGLVGDKLFEHLFFDMGQYLPEPVLHFLDKRFLVPVLGQLVDDLFQRSSDLDLVGRLQQIMLHAVLHGAVGILEFAEAGQQYEFDMRMGGVGLGNELQTVEPGMRMSQTTISGSPDDFSYA